MAHTNRETGANRSLYPLSRSCPTICTTKLVMAAFDPFGSNLFQDSIWSRPEPVTQSPGMAEYERLVDQWTGDSDRPLATSVVSSTALTHEPDHDLYTSAIRSLNLNQQSNSGANQMDRRCLMSQSQAQWTAPRIERESNFHPSLNFRSAARSQQTQRPVNQRQHQQYQYQVPHNQQMGRALLPQPPPVETTAHSRRTGRMPGSSSGSSYFSDPLIDLLTPPLRQIRGTAAPQAPLDLSYDLTYQLDRCQEQLKLMERERRKGEQGLSLLFPGRKVSGNNSIPVPKLPVNPTRVDRMVVDQVKEHAKIFTLMTLMEQLSEELPSGLLQRIQQWLEALRTLQTLRQEEMVADANHGPGVRREFGPVVSLAVKELCVATRAARTTFWAVYIAVADRVSANRQPVPPACDRTHESQESPVTPRGQPLIHVTLLPAA